MKREEQAVSRLRRRDLIQAALSAALLPVLPRVSIAQALARSKLTVGLSAAGMDYFPVFVAAARSWQNEGLSGEVAIFRSDAEAGQALIGGSIDIAYSSSSGLLNLIKAEQPVKAFYAGCNQANFSWFAPPSIKSWQDLKGKLVGTASPGSLTDTLTRHVLRKHGIDPASEVHFMASGGAPASWQALKARRLDLAILSPPVSWRAEEEGFTHLGRQSEEIAPSWPKVLLMAKTDLIARAPDLLRAHLRAHVAALRLARADTAFATRVMMDALKYGESDARRALEDESQDWDDRGRLPEAAMQAFWSVMVASGAVEAPWPEEKFFDRSFVDSFDQWAPRQRG